jgi:hypothetical protein
MKGWLPILMVPVLAACSGRPSPGGSPPAAQAAGASAASAPTSADVLRSWNDGAAKRAIVEFVGRVTREGSPDFVPIPERVATFDNDGTLWAEKPLPFQLLFIFDRVNAMAPQHSEWRNREPFASLLKGDRPAVAASGEHGLVQLMAATHTGMTIEEFGRSVQEWISSARHPQTRRLYTEMVYQPMLELLTCRLGRSGRKRLDRRQHAKGLERDLPAAEELTASYWRTAC